MEVRECMTRNPRFAVVDTSLTEAARIMANGGFGTLPVVSPQGTVIGIVTDRDICVAVANEQRPPSAVTVGEIMNRRVQTCRPDDDVETAMQIMRGHRVRRLPVITPEEKLLGILSMDDVVLHSDAGAGWITTGIGYGETVGTLKSIYGRPASARPTPVRD